MQEKFYREMSELHSSLKFQRATAQSEILCNPAKVKAAIATIGEICPGKNVCIRSLVKCLEQDYGVPEIYGIKWGFRGFCEDFPKHWERITSS